MTKNSKNPNNLTQNIESTKYLTGDIDLLSKYALTSVKQVSDELYDKTKFQVYINIVKEISKTDSIESNSQNPNIIESKVTESRDSKAKQIKDYENAFISKLDGQYAVIFLFYNDHHIDIRTNADFIDIPYILSEHAYPYLPAEKINSPKYNDDVNEGLSNAYLSLSHVVANHYKVKLNAPKPRERPSEATKIVIYFMLFVMIGLFILVSSGYFSRKNKQK